MPAECDWKTSCVDAAVMLGCRVPHIGRDVAYGDSSNLDSSKETLNCWTRPAPERHAIAAIAYESTLPTGTRPSGTSASCAAPGLAHASHPTVSVVALLTMPDSPISPRAHRCKIDVDRRGYPPGGSFIPSLDVRSNRKAVPKERAIPVGSILIFAGIQALCPGRPHSDAKRTVGLPFWLTAAQSA